MFSKLAMTLAALAVFSQTAFSCFAYDTCYTSFELGVGWRRDSIDWEIKRLSASAIDALVSSHTHFKEMDFYTVNGRIMWGGPCYYIRLSGDYGLSTHGRSKENFKIFSPLLGGSLDITTRAPVKRRSEVYDFNLAVGYPFSFDCYRWSVIPVIGFSFHRQHLHTKRHEESSSSSDYFNNSDNFTSSYPSSTSFIVDSSNPFNFPSSSDPFSYPSYSNPRIASVLGLSGGRLSNSYRFTWYGPFIGCDAAYALDSDWTLFGTLEIHFLDNCHRKRKTWTGVYFADHYHHQGWGYGYQATCGTNFAITSTWYGALEVDFKWWKGGSHHDTLRWCTVGTHASLGCEF